MPKNVWYWVLGVVAGVSLFSIFTAGNIYTSSSTFCASCHEMKTQYVSWTRSSHAQTECIACHSGVGIWDYINAKLAGSRKVFYHFVGYIPKIETTVEDAVCLRCHFMSKEAGYVYDTLPPDPTLIPSALHLVHFKDDEATCDACHRGLVHGSLSGGITVNTTGCESCHVRKKVYEKIKHTGS